MRANLSLDPKRVPVRCLPPMVRMDGQRPAQA